MQKLNRLFLGIFAAGLLLLSGSDAASILASNPCATPVAVEASRKTSGRRCQATTKKGTQCKRNAQKGSNYCWQHQ